MRVRPIKHARLKKWLVTGLIVILALNIVFVFFTTYRMLQDPEGTQQPLPQNKGATFSFHSLWGNQGVRNYFQRVSEATRKLEEIQITQDDYNEKLNALLLANNAPDIFEVSPIWLHTYVQKKWLMPLDGVLSPETENLLQEWDVVTEGSVYAMPTHTQTVWLVINQELLSQSGVSEYPKTLREMIHAAETISSRNQGYGKYGFILPINDSNLEEEFFLLEKALASTKRNFYNPSTRFDFTTVEPWLTALIEMKQNLGLSVDYKLATHESAFQQFTEGTIGMMLMDNLQIAQLEKMNLNFTYQIQLPPTVEQGEEQIIGRTSSGYLAVNANSVTRLPQELLQSIFGQGLISAVAEEKGYIGILTSDFSVSNFAVEGETEKIQFKNNSYTFGRFQIYNQIVNENADQKTARQLLQELSDRLNSQIASFQ